MKYKMIFLVILLCCFINVKADVNSSGCERTEINRLKELAKKIEFVYDYQMVDDKPVFTINAVNLNRELKAMIIKDYYQGDYRVFQNDGKGNGALTGFSEGERVSITMKAYVNNWCSGETVLTRSIKLPYYNYFYSEEKCKDNEDFKYCKQLVDTQLTEKNFNRQYELYLKNKENTKNKEEVVEKTNNDIYYIIGGIVAIFVIVAVVVMIFIKRKRKYSL